MENMALQEGTALHGGTYIIKKVLGRGGFGITYLALDITLEKEVAIKEFFPEIYCRRVGVTNQVSLTSQSLSELVDQLKSRFLKEARNLARLNHPNIVRIFSAFEDNDTAYYVMEYINGISLSQMVRQYGRLSPQNATLCITDVGRALEYLHSHHMTHFDVKPANIMLRASDNKPVLIDFGLSKNYDPEGEETTRKGPLGVSPGFSPVEQYSIGAVSRFSPRSDLYSLAATYYYLLTGQIPPEAPQNRPEMLRFPPGLPNNIREAIIKAMAMDIKRRHLSVREFLFEINSRPTFSGQTPSPSPENDETTKPLTRPRVINTPVNVDRGADGGENKHSGSNTTGVLTIVICSLGLLCIILLWLFLSNRKRPRLNKEYETPRVENVATEVKQIPTGGEQSAAPQVPSPANEPQEPPYGPFGDRNGVINFIEAFYRNTAQGIVNTSSIADNIETDFGSKYIFTRSGYVAEMNKYLQQQHFIRGDYDFNWGSLTTTPISGGGVKANYTYIYDMTCEKDGYEYTRRFQCTSEMKINSSGQVTYYKERNKKLGEW